MTSPQYNGAWVRFRLAVLARDGYRCQIHGPRCTHVATEVDHIRALALGGRHLDPGNARASCKTCNATAGARVGGLIKRGRLSARW